MKKNSPMGYWGSLMSDGVRLPNWESKRDRIDGPADRVMRFEKASRAIAQAIIRNRNAEQGGYGIPIVVEGNRDEQTLRALGFTGPIEKVNRGWDRSRLVAYLHSEYCLRKTLDGAPSVILLMDWDRTGGRIQASLRDRLMAMDSPVDEDLRNALLRSMKPEGRTVESLLPHVTTLEPLVRRLVSEIG
jgi:5S rRNA maturation endonuclease (ribonuclease M5)